MLQSTSKKYKIFFIGKFTKLHDEEYIARSFEYLGHEVLRCEQSITPDDIGRSIEKTKPDIILYTKWDRPTSLDKLFTRLKREGVMTVCWVFDLYWGYAREHQIHTRNFFKSDYVFTTDGGNHEKWKEAGVNHFCVRQGIYRDECFLPPESNLVAANAKPYEHNVIFVGSENPLYTERTERYRMVEEAFNKVAWFGRSDTDEVRGTKLNELFAKTKIVIGDSYYSPNYWSNRIVETLGRGGFLIHQEVEGLKEEYPYLVTYKRNNMTDLKNKIKYYIENNAEREKIAFANFQWVRDHYTMDKKCAELLNLL